jgi:hypothetical protein
MNFYFLLQFVNSMLEIILITSILFLILTFFYKQAICEFRINQIEWSQKSHIPKLLGEKLPLVVRSIPNSTCWTQSDVLLKRYDHVPVFHEMSVSEWISSISDTVISDNGTVVSGTTNVVCPWRYSQAEHLASISGIAVWAAKWINPSVVGWHRFWTLPRYHCWAGNRGLHKTVAWTLFITDSELSVTIMPESMESFLPAQWLNRFPTDFTQKDTPFVTDLKYIDILLRPGTALFIPPHWFVCYTGTMDTDTDKSVPMACTISYHTPISYLAFQTSPYILH